MNLNSHWLGHELGHPAHYIHEARAKQEELVHDLEQILACNCYALVHLGFPCFRHPSVESLALRMKLELATAKTEIAEAYNVMCLLGILQSPKVLKSRVR